MAAGKRAVAAPSAEEREEVQELLPAAVSLLLGTLPDRWVPSRGFVTVCTELTIGLVDAWLMAYVAAGLDSSALAQHLQEQLEPLAGVECSHGWWADAAERAGTEKEAKRPVSARLAAPNGGCCEARGGGGYQFAMHALVTSLLRHSTASIQRSSSQSTGNGTAASNASTSARSSEPADSFDKHDVWLRFGAFWVLCALDDIIGSVVSHCARKAAMVRGGAAAARRPASGGSGARPASSGGSRPTTGSRSTTPAVSSTNGAKSAREARPATGARPGAGAGKAEQPERLELPRLLALKHFVAAARNDNGLKACHILEACLVEVATGQTPHVATAELLAIDAYQKRLMSWAEQESGPDASEEAKQRAVAQAMKGVPAKAVPDAASAPPGATARGKATSAGAGRQAAGAPARPQSADESKARQSWLPQAFVNEFNAEGEEVEPEVDSNASEAEAFSPPRPGAADAAGAAGAARTAGYADKAQVNAAPRQLVDAAPPRPAGAAPLHPAGAESTRAARAAGTGAKVSTISAPPSKSSKITAPAVRRSAPSGREARVLFAKAPESLS
mmetsp:Transcript_112779/g.204971  ORF Transcript_112779/g.204971 Transcript_112779/m.204971 type:complete len:561 (+) Transcript_112779:60-1742(+)